MHLIRAVLAQKKETLTEKLLKVVDDYDIYCNFMECQIALGEGFNSPLRAKDDCPSLRFFIPNILDRPLRPTEIWFKDMAMGVSGDVFKFTKVYAMHHFAVRLETRYDVIQFIDHQMELGLFTTTGPKRIASKRVFEPRGTVDIYYKSRPYTLRDLEYWKKLDLEEPDLKFWDVRSVRYLLDEKGLVRKEFKLRDLCFVYPIYDKEKLYQPEAPRNFKFRNTCPGNDYHYYQGFNKLRGKKLGVRHLIITKSQKDVMVFYKYFNEFLEIPVDVIAPHAESINLTKEFIDLVKANYDHIICVSDFDLAGVKFANQCKRHGFMCRFISTERILINGSFKVLDKDISDYRDNNGRLATIKLLRSWKLDAI